DDCASAQTHDKGCRDGGDEDTRTGCREPVAGEDCSFSMWQRNNGRNTHDYTVEAGHREFHDAQIVDESAESWRSPYCGKECKDQPGYRRTCDYRTVIFFEGAGLMGHVPLLWIENSPRLPHP